MSSYASPAAGSPAVLSDLASRLTDRISDRTRRIAARSSVELALIAGAAGLVGVSAQFAISPNGLTDLLNFLHIPVPGTPVPFTLQTFAVLLTGAALGWQRAAASMTLYLLVGSLGVPWFAQGKSGFGGPTFGYVIGFIAAAVLVGFLASRRGDRTPLRTIATMSAGTLVIYAFGVPWLAADLDLSMSTALEAGMYPFVATDALKVLAAAGLLPATWALVKRTLR